MGVLSKIVIAVTGSLPYEPQQIKKWVEANGGKWSVGVKKGVTHLLASKDDWKKATNTVQQASKLGVWIVSYDWFEDSLQSKRKLGEKRYTWDFLGKERRKRKQLKRVGAAADGTSRKITRKPKKSSSFFFNAKRIPDTPFESATEALKRKWAKREVENGASEGEAQNPIEIEDDIPSQIEPSPSSSTKSPSPSLKKKATTPIEPQAKTPHIKDLYHYYLDTTGFEYKVVLARSDFSSNSFARYHIGLLESHTKPHTYCTVVQYTPPAKTAPESISNVRGIAGAGLRNPLLNFLNGGKNGGTSQQRDVYEISNSIDPVSPQHPEAQHAEATRLQSLVTKPAPSSYTPYKALICLMNSTYPCAWRAFRHAFRDLTLLSWEERFDANKTVQKARAQQLGIEPFLYAKPAKGLPMGLLPQEAGLSQGTAHSLDIQGDADEGYARNAFQLPNISHPLSTDGAIGAALHRAEEEQKKKDEENRREAEREEEAQRRMRGEAREKKPNYNKPMFNCATGRPQTDAYGQYTRIKQTKPFPNHWYG